jgi:hypothetical protein
MATMKHVSPALAPRAHNPFCGGSSPSTATNPLGAKPLPALANGKPSLSKVNRCAIGQSLAILFCPGPNGCTVGVKIDKEDAPRVLASGLWRVGEFPAGLYCYKIGENSRKRGNVYLHRFIHRAERGEYIDHIHHRTLDNRKSETRKCTQGLNQLNRRVGGEGVSKRRGVIWKRGKWEAVIRLDNRSHYLGRFTDKDVATVAVNNFFADHGVEFKQRTPAAHGQPLTQEAAQ